MAQIRIAVELPGKRRKQVTLAVEDTVRVGDLIETLVKRRGYPLTDLYRQPVTYHLRSLSGSQVLASTLPLSQAGVGPGARLVLECEEALHTTVQIEGIQAPMGLSPLGRRSLLTTAGVFSTCALTGLFSGIGVALAQRSITRISSPMAAVRTLTRLSTFSGHHDLVRVVAWSSAGQLASGADDAQLLLWRPEGTILQQIHHPASVVALAWSPAGQRLVSGSETQVRFFNVQTGALLAALAAHRAPVTALAWSSSNGHPVISGAQDKLALVWETQNYSVQGSFTRHTTAIASVSAQAHGIVASSSQGGVVRMWQLDTTQEVHAFYQDAMIPMLTVAFDPTGARLAVGGNDGQVRIWNNGLSCQQVVTTDEGPRCADLPQRFHTRAGGVRALAWSPDGRYLATGGDDHQIAAWDMAGGGTPAFIGQHNAPVLSVAWSTDGQRIAAASGATVTIWQR